MNETADTVETTPILNEFSNGTDAQPTTAPATNEDGSWVSPRAVLFTFTALNFLLYFDRGATAGALSSIRVDRYLVQSGDVLSDARSGLLVSGFTIGYLLTSPLFASRGSAWGSRAVIQLGMLLWCVACLGCAMSLSYGFLLLCRVVVGVGEAAFVGFTVTIIDNIAPTTHRTSWIGIFYAMIPVGMAVGMGCGGLLASYPTLWGIASWRLIFLGEVVAVLPILVPLYAIPSRFHLPPAQGDATQLTFWTATMRVFRNANYMLLVLGLATYCFVTGAVSTWGIPLLHEGPLQLSKAAAAVFMGLATTVAGVVGSLLGGVVVDRLGGSGGAKGAIQCQKFDIVMVVFATPCGVVALLSSSLWCFTGAFVAAVVALFAITAPVNASILTVVPAELRPYAVSYSVFFIHLLGNFPAPIVTGLVSDYFGRHCHGLSQAACTLDSVAFQCTWVSDAGAGHCTNRLQLRNALLLVFTYLLIAPPCWAAVWWRLSRGVEDASRAVDVAVDGTTTPSSLLSAPLPALDSSSACSTSGDKLNSNDVCNTTATDRKSERH